MTVAELEATMPEQEFAGWLKFFRVEPWGAEMEFFRAATIAATVANFSGMRRKGAKAYGPEDFMPRTFRRRPAGDLDPKRIRAGLIAAFGDRIKKKET